MTSLEVGAGDVANLVVAVSIPSDANKNEYQVELVATSKNYVINGTPWSQSNLDKIKITDGPVLVAKKQIVKHDEKKGEVTYRIELTNNGADLKDGGIYDFFPDYLKIDQLNGNTLADSRLGNIEIKASKDLKGELPAKAAGEFIPENNHAKGLYVPITDLKGGANTAFEFTVTYQAKSGSGANAVYKFEAGTELKNKAFVGYGQKSGSQWEKFVETNTTVTKLPHLLGVTAHNHEDKDALETPRNPVNAGGIAEFVNVITNLGNGADTFNLKIENRTFAPGTVFTLWDETGNIKLTDTSGDGIVDTGELQSLFAGKGTGNKIKIMVKAQLPAGVSGTVDYEADLIATSVTDSSVTDKVTEKLTQITAASIDLANYKATNTDNEFKGEVTNITDFFKPNAKDDYDPIDKLTSTLTRKPGDVAEFGLYIANKSAIGSSFSIESVIANNPGWKVSYFHDGVYDKDGKEIAAPSGKQITVTPKLPGLSVMKVIAKITIPADAKHAAAGNYDVTFKAISNANRALTNSTKNRIVIKDQGLLEFAPGGANQVEAGGSVFYEHILANRGNVDLSVTIKETALDAGWSYVLFEKDDQGTLTQIKNGGPIPLAQAVEKRIVVKVMAPANAAPGDVFNLELTATGNNTAGTKELAKASLIDTTSVIKGQVHLRKQVKMLSGKNKDENAIKVDAKALASGDFVVNSTEKVVPGQDYVVWQLVATNMGDAPAKQVTIRDAAPAFTTLVADSAYVVGGDSKGKVVSGVSGTDVVFNVGKGATDQDGQGGTLQPGESVEVRFVVKVN